MSRFRCEFFFFFQAEDGIRDLVRSRGLGDVYKRQVLPRPEGLPFAPDAKKLAFIYARARNRYRDTPVPVSYTHLTLPTSDLV